MSDVAIVTDTTHYLPREMVRAADVSEVSLYVTEGERHEREAEMPTFDAFYERLRSSAEIPTTSQPSVGGALKVKPILTIDGELVPIERVRTSGRAFERMIDYLQSRKADGA